MNHTDTQESSVKGAPTAAATRRRTNISVSYANLFSTFLSFNVLRRREYSNRQSDAASCLLFNIHMSEITSCSSSSSACVCLICLSFPFLEIRFMKMRKKKEKASLEEPKLLFYK
jgi:hypothetical protein